MKKSPGRPKKKFKQPKLSSLNFAHTWDELARILSQRIGVSVTRKSLQNWRNPRLFPDLADKWPRPRPDGRHDVAAWIRFMFDTGRNRADETLESDELDSDRTTARDWKIYREELLCREAERRIARGDNLLLVATELEIPIGAMLAAINSKLALYPSRTARFMVMKRDVADAEQTLRDEMDAVLKDLNLADYIEPPIAEIAAEVSIDAEIIREAFRRIGHRVIASSIEAETQVATASPKTDAEDAQTCAVTADPKRVVKNKRRRRRGATATVPAR